MNITPDVIYEFIRIVRDKKIVREYDDDFISELEHFAILIGAGGKDCPFRIAVDEYILKLKKEKEKSERKLKSIEENPMTPKDDIHQLYNWEADTYHCPRDYLRKPEWNSTVPVYIDSSAQTKTCFYYRKRKD